MVIRIQLSHDTDAERLRLARLPDFHRRKIRFHSLQTAVKWMELNETHHTMYESVIDTLFIIKTCSRTIEYE